MIVNEKGLLRAMKEAWKHGGGYNVAVELDLGNVVNMVIGTGWWTVEVIAHLIRAVMEGELHEDR